MFVLLYFSLIMRRQCDDLVSSMWQSYHFKNFGKVLMCHVFRLGCCSIWTNSWRWVGKVGAPSCCAIYTVTFQGSSHITSNWKRHLPAHKTKSNYPNTRFWWWIVHLTNPFTAQRCLRHRQKLQGIDITGQFALEPVIWGPHVGGGIHGSSAFPAPMIKLILITRDRYILLIS